MCCTILYVVNIYGMLYNSCSPVLFSPSGERGERRILPAPPLAYFDRPNDPDMVEIPTHPEEPLPLNSKHTSDSSIAASSAGASTSSP